MRQSQRHARAALNQCVLFIQFEMHHTRRLGNWCKRRSVSYSENVIDTFKTPQRRLELVYEPHRVASRLRDSPSDTEPPHGRE